MDPIPSCYVHIPFCASLCRYCAFDRSLNLEKVESWLDTICLEAQKTLSGYAAKHPDFRLKTLYFGGGTPSILSCDQIRRLSACFRPYLDADYEWTIEANPESLDKQKLRTYRKLGINRISIGIQTFDDERLSALGRHHDSRMAIRAVEMAKQAGFERISADLMYGFSQQSVQELEKDVEQFLKLQITHLSIYSLILEENSVMGVLKEEAGDPDLCALMYEKIALMLVQAGFDHYETSSFARKGHVSRHNLMIWQDGLYFGIGHGACGRDENGLYHHAGSLHSYIKNGPELEYDENENPWFDAIMTGLRTKQGVHIGKWQHRYSMDFFERYRSVLEKYQDFFHLKDDRLFLDEQGREILDTILVEFLMED